MKRILIRYGGELFSTAGREMEDLEDEFREIVAGGDPKWVTLNTGDGRYSEARVLIAPGIPISLTAVVVDGRTDHDSVDGAQNEINPSDIDTNKERA